MRLITSAEVPDERSRTRPLPTVRRRDAPHGVLHVPLGELSARAGEVPTDKPVVAICRSGRRSAQATASQASPQSRKK